MARWLALLVQFDERRGWSDDGFPSCAEWVSWRCSIAPVTAREYVRVARRLRELPAIRRAFESGELSYSKVRALSRIDGPVDDEQLLTYAQHATAAQLVRIVAAYRGVTRQEAQRAHRERFLDVVPDEDGSFVIRGRLCAEDGALVLRALEHVADPPPRPTAGDGLEATSPSGAARADALVHLAHLALEEGAGGRSAGGRTEVVVHIDVAALAAGVAGHDGGRVARARATGQPPRCELAGGVPLARETARRLCCDAGLVGVVEQDGRPLSVGRRTRAIPPAIRRALRARQHACAFPGCDRSRWLDAHHVQHWADGGETSLENLVHLCRHHHRLVHEGGWSLRADGVGGHRFVRPDGRVHRSPPRACRGDGAALVNRQRRRGIRPGAGSLQPHATDLRYDLGLTIDALLAGAAGAGP